MERQEQIIVIGASAGGLTPMLDVLTTLPATLDVPVVVAMHGAADSRLTHVLSGRTPLPVQRIRDGQTLEKGVIAVCPGGENTRIDGSVLRLGRGGSTARFRPSIDLLFQSAAETFGSGTVGVVLSGNLNDGTAGAQAVYAEGGTMLVQAPAEADFPSMPASIVLHDHPDAVLTSHEISIRLQELVDRRRPVMPIRA